MSLCKRRTITPARLAANAANARKSTGPRTPRGKMVSRENGRKGGRPPKPGSIAFLKRKCVAEGRTWGPGDPAYLRLWLSSVKKTSPTVFESLMRWHPEYWETLRLDPEWNGEL